MYKEIVYKTHKKCEFKKKYLNQNLLTFEHDKNVGKKVILLSFIKQQKK